MKRRQNSGRMFVIRQWKKFVLQMGIGICLCSAKPIDGFAAPPMDDWFQKLEQREDLPKILPDAGKSTEWEMEPEADDWEEEFTDTDSRRGILAVRGEVFQGFGGQVQLAVREMEGGRETVISLHREGGYIANQELRPRTYQVVSVEADSDGRKFDCYVETEELVVDTDRVTMCQVFVNPGSVYQVVYEETEKEAAEKKQGQDNNLEIGKEETESEESGRENDLETVSRRMKDQRLLPAILAALGVYVSFVRIIQIKRGRR